MSIGLIWTLTLLFKIALLPWLPITPDEAYYFEWSRHLHLSYFDHPPMIAWLMHLAIPFWKTPLGVRLPAVIVCQLSFLPWLTLMHDMGFEKTFQKRWLWLVLLMPMLSVGSFIATPDTPLILFWSLACVALWRREWIWLGFFIGCGLLSKYTMVVFGLGAILWLWRAHEGAEIRRRRFWLGVALIPLLFLPVIIWNSHHSWASFAFQAHHGLSDQNHGFLHPKYALEYLSGQWALLNPIAALFGALAAWRMIRWRSQTGPELSATGVKAQRQTFLLIFALTPLVFFLATSFRARVEANWPVCAYPAFGILAINGFERWQSRRRYLAKAFLITQILSTTFFVAVISQVIHPWLPLKHDHSEVTRRWNHDVAATQDFFPLFARSYQMAAYFSYYRPAGHEVFKPQGMDRRDVYDFWPEADLQKALRSNSAVYMVMNSDDSLPIPAMKTFVKALPSGSLLWKLQL